MYKKDPYTGNLCTQDVFEYYATQRKKLVGKHKCPMCGYKYTPADISFTLRKDCTLAQLTCSGPRVHSGISRCIRLPASGLVR